LEATLALQYAGQGYALEVPFRPTEATPAELTAAFEASHETRYGYRLGRPLTLERLRVRGTTPSALAGAPVALEAPTTPEARPPWAVTGHGSVPRYRRSELREGDELRGPAILEETTATHWLAPGWRAECLPGGHLRLKKLT
jgi:N-methylhydantoinase A/oxoprolinase/acetone carboxylase beta subunit